MFTAALLITNGGPQNATLFLVLYVYRTAFQTRQMGYAATLSWVLFLILTAMSFILFFFAQRYFIRGIVMRRLKG